MKKEANSKAEKKAAKKAQQREKAKQREEAKKAALAKKAEKKQKKTAASTQKSSKKPVKVQKVVDADYAENDELEEDTAEEKVSSGVKIYHVALRKDYRWQVKLGKGSRALKIFRTQAEAIAFAKQMAKNQDGHIVIHKVDGKMRKQHYGKD